MTYHSSEAVDVDVIEADVLQPRQLKLHGCRIRVDVSDRERDVSYR